jgi:60 kDa SS-A/Ro ribonucleoprotein
MANKELFSTCSIKPTNTINDAGGVAYAMEAEEALAQLACTGFFGSTYYASAETQLSRVIEFANVVSDEYLAKLAVYSRTQGYMKDMPAVLCAILSTRDRWLFKKVFVRVIDNAKMLRTFVQVMRSGAVGRKSLGSLPKKLVQQWLNNQTDENLFKNSVGNSPSLADIIRMVHPRPATKSRENLYAYLLGREYKFPLLPALVQEFENFKASLKSFDSAQNTPDVPMQMLTSLPLTVHHWSNIALTTSWTTQRMNIRTFQRHGVFEYPLVVDDLAKQLADPDRVKRSKVFPYQLLMAYKMSGDTPSKIQNALQDAMEVATDNVESFGCSVAVCPDVSGSMSWSVGNAGYGSAVKCIDVAALIASVILRKNEDSLVIPFERKVVNVRLNPRDSVMTNSSKLAAVGGGGTNISAPLKLLNEQNTKVDLVIVVSDNESWADQRRSSGTAMFEQWRILKKRNPRAKLVCIDIQPNVAKQVPNDPDILHVGGFSDNVFDVITSFVKAGGKGWVDVIKNVTLG